MITPTRTGRFTLICTELCGLGHATMRAPVRVLSQADFAAWLEQTGPGGAGRRRGGRRANRAKAKAAAAAARSSARRPSRRPAAAAATRFKKAGTDAQIGPALDDLTAAAKRRVSPVPEFVR